MTKTVPLTRGKFAVVDDEDFDFLVRWKWNCSAYGYAVRNWRCEKGEVRVVYMHRVINGTPDGMETDHVNSDRLDNRRINLRTATAGQNQRNQKPRKKSSKYKGVSWAKDERKWIAYISVGYKNKGLGRFVTEEAAALAYNAAALKYFGDFAQINVIDKTEGAAIV